MNQLEGTIHEVRTAGNLSVITIQVKDNELTAVVLENPKDNAYLKPGNQILALFKETEVAIAKDLRGELSIRNRFSGSVEWIETGELLSKIGIRSGDVVLQSVITTRSCNQLNIHPGDRVTALVKSNEIMLMNPLDNEK